MRLIPCDLQPDVEGFRDLESRHPGALRRCTNRSISRCGCAWPPKTLLFLSGSFHHLPPATRRQVLRSLTKSADGGMMFEPLRKTLISVLFVFLSLFPALLLPLVPESSGQVAPCAVVLARADCAAAFLVGRGRVLPADVE